MWELLKKIAKAGWKPYGKGINELTEEEKNIRLITSRNSGLWQFVCENGMIKEQKEEKLIEIYDNLRGRTETVYDDEKYEYRLIESALKDESELEQFLLDNIVIKDEKNIIKD